MKAFSKSFIVQKQRKMRKMAVDQVLDLLNCFVAYFHRKSLFQITCILPHFINNHLEKKTLRHSVASDKLHMICKHDM